MSHFVWINVLFVGAVYWNLFMCFFLYVFLFIVYPWNKALCAVKQRDQGSVIDCLTSYLIITWQCCVKFLGLEFSVTKRRERNIGVNRCPRSSVFLVAPCASQTQGAWCWQTWSDTIDACKKFILSRNTLHIVSHSTCGTLQGQTKFNLLPAEDPQHHSASCV